MTQYKKYLEGNYTKATIEAYFKGISIFNNFLGDREITGAIYRLSVDKISKKSKTK